MSLLSTLKKGYIAVKTSSGYQKFLPRTLANLVSTNDGGNVEDKINQINTNLSNLNTKITPVYENLNSIKITPFVNALLEFNAITVNFKAKASGWGPNKTEEWVRGTVYFQNLGLSYSTIGHILLFTDGGLYSARLNADNGSPVVREWVQVAKF